MSFDYQLTNKNNINIVALEGDLIDKTEAGNLLADLEKNISENNNKFVLNLEKLNYMNSSGLNVMLNILTKSRKNGGDVAVCGANNKINQLLIITKLNSVFNVCDNTEKAIEILSK